MGGCVRLWLVLGLALAAAVRPFGRPPLPPSGRSAGQTEEADEGQESSWSGQPPRIHEELYVPRQNLLPEPGWRPRGGPEVPPDAELDRRRRPARSAEDEEQQQSTSGQPYESDWATTARAAADAANVTRSSPGDGRQDDDDEAGRHGNGSAPAGGSPGLFNPFYPLAESSYPAYAMLVLGALVLALGVVGNMAVMCIVWNNYYMRSAWNYLLASMAFWDFLVLVFCLPVVILNQLSHRRVLGDITCRMVPYMEVTSLGITSFSLCALGIDRFHAATSSSKPRPRRVDRCRSVLLKLLLVWMISLLLSSPELFLWQLSQSVSPSTGRLVDACSITPSSSLSLYLPDSLHSLLVRYQQGRLWWCLGCYFCLPVLFTLLCQLATCNVTSDSGSAQKHRAPDDCVANQTRRQHVAVERRLNRTVLALAVVYGVCVLPEHVCNVTLTYGPVRVSRETAAMLALMNHFLLFFKSSVTPVLQLCLCKALGQAFMDCCCCCCQECQPTGTQESPGSTHAKLKTANEVASSSIFFDKAKETSAVSSISS